MSEEDAQQDSEHASNPGTDTYAQHEVIGKKSEKGGDAETFGAEIATNRPPTRKGERLNSTRDNNPETSNIRTERRVESSGGRTELHWSRENTQEGENESDIYSTNVDEAITEADMSSSRPQTRDESRNENRNGQRSQSRAESRGERIESRIDSRNESRVERREERGRDLYRPTSRSNEGTMTSTPREESQQNSEDFNDFVHNNGENEGKKEEIEREEGEEESYTEEIEVEEEPISRNGNVIIERDNIKKPFLGGFRHKQTGVEYHHASTQTYKPTSLRVLQKMLITKYHRDTQTTETVHNNVQPLRECGTQMARTGLYISDEGAKEIVPRPYFTADQLFDLKTKKAIKIQCMARRWFARRTVARLREARAAAEDLLALQQEEKQKETEEVRQREIERRRNPRTKEDFEVLYRELDAWHQQETARIVASTEEGSETRKAEMYALLQKQTELLQTIDRLKLQAAKANQGPKIAKNLSQMAAPKKWANGVVQVTTPFTKRAEELMVLYHGLKEPLLTVDQRLDVLLHVKWTVQEFTCQLTKDIIELIDREADLLNRGRSEKSVEALRQRISNLFLRFIETPEFNPEAANLKTKAKKIST